MFTGKGVMTADKWPAQRSTMSDEGWERYKAEMASRNTEKAETSKSEASKAGADNQGTEGKGDADAGDAGEGE